MDGRAVFVGGARAAERARKEREGILVTCGRCDRQIRWYVAEVPAGEVVCGGCEDWG